MFSFIQKFFAPKKIKRNTFLRTGGSVYDLQKIYSDLNKQYFDSKLDLRISWSKKTKVPRTRIVFGSYQHQNKLIRINPLLDQKDIPEYFIRYIIFHEMLHEFLPPIKERGKRKIHHKAFKEGEKSFQEYSLAKNFLKSWQRKMKNHEK